MKKVVITGGLGYIGTELCKIYSGESRFKNITVIDNRFVSERVKQLRDWGINFVHADILDVDAIKSYLNDADVVIHLAGVTDVAYVKNEANDSQDKKITEVGINGTRNIINNVKSSCKIIFPSTHVVFEGFDETKENIKEDETPKPVLSYAKGKVQSEIDLQQSGLNYVILRLATVCGYSLDTMRMNIMPNLFSRIASQNGTIKLFSKGVQLKSLVPLIDVARCMKFMEDNNINNEVFHCSKTSTTVREVAELCKKYNPNLNIVETDDEIPNLGYTISNKKLLSTGFKFLYDVEESIKEMITNWSEKKINPKLEFIDCGGKELIDQRGKIVNYELTEPINLIGYIESKKGTVRANHYHPIQEQKCLLIKGQYVSVYKDLSYPDAPVETQIINAGDLSTIKPNVAHTMVFTEDSIFLNLVRGEREHENYGITHTMPYVLVDEEKRKEILNNYKVTCRSCDSKKLKKFLSLGNSPLANNLLNSNKEQAETFPLEINYCVDCHNCQLSYNVPSSKMFDEYLYLSSTSKEFRKHFEDAAKKYIKEYNLNEGSFVIDIGSNDGIALKPLIGEGIKVLGVEPAKNVALIANESGVPTINDYFCSNVVESIIQKHGKADLVTASNVFAHADDLKEIANNVSKILKDDGVFIVEVQYLLDTIKDLTFDNVYHEHFNYWSVSSIVKFFSNLNLSVVDVEHINTHGGSIRVYIKKTSNKISKNVEKFIKEEQDFGLLEFSTYENFALKVKEIKLNVVENFVNLKKKYKIIAGYAAPAKATTSLNYFKIDKNYIDYIIEDNQLKNNKYVPVVNIPIKNKEYSQENTPDLVVVMAWNFFNYIKQSNEKLLENTTFISIKDLYKKDFYKSL